MSHPVGTVESVELLADLTEAQRRAVTSPSAPLCVLAAAGSGKTRVLTRRIAYRVQSGTADPGHVLALTFTRRAAAELGARLRSLGIRDRVTAGTFHAVAFARLRQRWADRGERVPVVLERKGRLLAEIAVGRPGLAELPVAGLAAEIEWAQARGIGPDTYADAARAAKRRVPVDGDALGGLYGRYQIEKRRRGLVDFEDLLGLLAGVLETDPRFAAGERWQWRHLFVDEFQDVNPLQDRLLSAWLGDRLDLCVVGDPNQAIYAWNGADPRFLTGFCDRYRRAEVIRLDDNHRSSPQIVAAANAVLGSHAASTQSDGPPATVRRYESEHDEARAVAAAIRLRHGPGESWSQMAVLARTNAQLVVIQQAMRAAGIPSRMAGGGLLERPEIGTALRELQSTPGQQLRGRLPDLLELANEEGDEERHRSVLVLAELGREFLQMDGRGTVEEFRAWLGASLGGEPGGDNAPSGDAVVLSTFHRAKGLEWPVVYLVGLEDGLVPLGRDIDEERRLLYVGITRAEREVHCSWAARRSFGAASVPRQPTPWLAAIETAIAHQAGGAGGAGEGGGELHGRPGEPQASFRAARQKLRRLSRGAGSADDSDPDVLIALRAWRQRAARAAQVSPHVVCHDATLAALACARPSTASELLAVPGLGPVKAARYGEALLAVVAQCRRSA